jgi:hypothetical protein
VPLDLHQGTSNVVRQARQSSSLLRAQGEAPLNKRVNVTRSNEIVIGVPRTDHKDVRSDASRAAFWRLARRLRRVREE